MMFIAGGMDGGGPGAGIEIKVNGKPVPSKGTVRPKQGDELTGLSPGGGYGIAV